MLGRRAAARGARLGFAGPGDAAHRGQPGQGAPPEGTLVRLPEPGHGMVLAGTGQGKLVNVIAPNVLMHEGPLFVIDPKGEIASVTARHRRSVGEVIIIDPFECVPHLTQGAPPGALNPFDLARLPGVNIDDAAEALAWELTVGHESARDPYWVHAAASLIAGLIAGVSEDPDPAQRGMGRVVDLLAAEDVIYDLAVLLEVQRVKGDFARSRIAQFLATPGDSHAATRGCVLNSAQQVIHCFEAESVRRAVNTSSFALEDVVEGERPMTVYFVFPPARALSHRGLLRMWVTTLLQALMHRAEMPSLQTLLVVDEAANLGTLDQLPLMHSYARGTGTSVLTAWQSIGQLMDLYPNQFRTICENCTSIQAFGLHSTAIEAAATFLGVPGGVLRDQAPDEQLVVIGSREGEVLRRVDYRTDPVLAARADWNPRYARRGGWAPPALAKQPCAHSGRAAQ
ncbi:MAG: type IV secretory system conjugative DNA transfer family protein [Planctomycetota bacterium]